MFFFKFNVENTMVEQIRINELRGEAAGLFKKNICWVVGGNKLGTLLLLRGEVVGHYYY